MSNPASPLRVLLVGAGNRGREVYARALTKSPTPARLVAAVDPASKPLHLLAEEHDLNALGLFSDLDEALAQGPDFDLAILATPDPTHLSLAKKLFQTGKPCLLEKPLATTFGGLEELEEAWRSSPGSQALVGVCHVLRFTPFFRALSQALEAKILGRVVQFDLEENIGFWHFAHSYVRGNWRQRGPNGPSILTKSSHDLDLLLWLAPGPLELVSARGGRFHFRAEDAPSGAPEFCSDGCAHESSCPYAASKIYLERFLARPHWPNTALTPEPNPESVARALAKGPYGRCVYRADNDVKDHYEVEFRSAEGAFCRLLVTAFSEENTRQVRIRGTHGELQGDLTRNQLEHLDFSSGVRRSLLPNSVAQDAHGGGDQVLIDQFLAQVARAESGAGFPTSLEVSLESHRLALQIEARIDEAQGELSESPPR